MWTYLARRLLYNVPIFLGIIFILMVALRVKDPIPAMLGKHASAEAYQKMERQLGLDRPFLVQYVDFLGDVATLHFDEESFYMPGLTAGEILRKAIPPSMAITLPALALSTLISVAVALISAFYRGRAPDRVLVFLAVLGMSVSFLVYIILGQYFAAFRLNQWLGRGNELFAIEGYETSGAFWWTKYCLLPVLISVVVSMGYDTRFYRAVMVEESSRDYITTAVAKGASKRKVMFVHMLKNAMIPIITRVMITLPFLITGDFLLEMYFNIPGMGNNLIRAINANDFPVIQMFGAIFAVLFILTNILTDVAYALVDPRVRLS